MRFGGRFAVAAAGAGLALGLACLGMRFFTAPAWASLAFEPLTLLFLPGLAYCMAVLDSHEIDANLVVKATFWMYFGVFWLVLEARAWGRRRQTGRQGVR